MKKFVLLGLFLFLVNVTFAQETKIKWFGHAAFSITTPKGKVILIDPWISNPKNPESLYNKNLVGSLGKVDYILLTHGHRDHVGETSEIAKATGAVLITNPELTRNLIKLADFPEKDGQATPMGIGGETIIADGEVTIAMTMAIHSSSVFNPKAGPNEPERAYGGNPAGFVVINKNGPTIYHTGDTAYFKDMETIGEQYQIDLALLNIGGHYGMEPRMAAKAALSVKTKLAVPMHFGTDESMNPNSDSFSAELKKLKIPFYEMKPGDTITYKGKLMAKK
jgi:L-ascorbate metabolism protein UlaG (beta-lactamase superfamily)